MKGLVPDNFVLSCNQKPIKVELSPISVTCLHPPPDGTVKDGNDYKNKIHGGLKMSKRLSVFIVMLAMIVLIAACGGGNVNTSSNSDAGANGGNDVPAAGGAEEVTINFMHHWPIGGAPTQNRVLNQIIDEYVELNQHVTIKVEELENEQYKTKLQVVSASNTLPDVGITWPAGFMEPYVMGNRFASLNDLLNDGLGEQFVAGTTEAYSVDGVTYALPLELNIAPIYYNKEIFAQHGLDVPQTYDDLKHIITTLSDNGMAPIALGNKDRWTGSLWYMYLADRIGGPETLRSAIDGSGSFDDPALISAAAEIQELVDLNGFNRGFNGLSNDEGKAEFLNSDAAMYLMGTWEVPNFTTNPDIPQEFRDSVGFFKFPVVEGGNGDLDSWVGGPGVGLFVAEDSDVKEESFKFLQFFVERWGEISVTEAGVIPGTKVDTSQIDLPPMFIELLNELGSASNITLFADVQMSSNAAEVHLNMIQALFGDAVTPEEFAQNHVDAINAEE